MDRQDQITRDLYEAIGTHFVDLFVNAVHSAAQKSFQDRKSASVTDAYRTCVQAYVTSNKTNPDVYKRTLENLLQYVKNIHQFSFMTYTQMVDRLASTLIPDDMFSATRDENRDEIVSTAICDLIASLGKYVTQSEVIERVITPKLRTVDTVATLQNFALNAMNSTRDRMLNKFLGQVTQAKDSVSLAHVNKLNDAIRKLATQVAEKNEQLAACEEELEVERAERKSQKRLFKDKIMQVSQAMQHYDARIVELERENHAMRMALDRRSGNMPAPALAPTLAPTPAAPQVSLGSSIDPFAGVSAGPSKSTGTSASTSASAPADSGEMSLGGLIDTGPAVPAEAAASAPAAAPAQAAEDGWDDDEFAALFGSSK